MSLHTKTQKGLSLTDRVLNSVLSIAPTPLPPVDSLHPLDPLTRGEVLAVGKACKAHAAATMGLHKLRFNSITLQEPPKAALVAYNLSPEKTILPRRAEAVIQTLVGSKVVEAVLELTGSSPAVLSWTVVEGVQPPVTIQDTVEAEEICKADPALQRLLRERYGVKDMGMVAFDPWYYGDRFASKESKYSDAGRLIQCFTYLRVNNPADNH